MSALGVGSANPSSIFPRSNLYEHSKFGSDSMMVSTPSICFCRRLWLVSSAIFDSPFEDNTGDPWFSFSSENSDTSIAISCDCWIGPWPALTFLSVTV